MISIKDELEKMCGRAWFVGICNELKIRDIE